MINKQLKAGQIFTMFDSVWQVRKCTRWPCSGCELYRYWKAFLPHLDNPCDKLCWRNKEIIPFECVVVSIKRK